MSLVDRQLSLVQGLLPSGRGMLVDLHHFAHGALTNSNTVNQFFAGIDKRLTFRQYCQKVCTGILVRLGFCLGFRPQFQGDLAQCPLVQISPALLGVQCPLLASSKSSYDSVFRTGFLLISDERVMFLSMGIHLAIFAGGR